VKHGHTTGLVSADRSGTSDTPSRWKRAQPLFRAAAEAAAEVGEWQLQRLAQDAAERCQANEEIEWRQEKLQLGGLDGKDPSDASEAAFI